MLSSYAIKAFSVSAGAFFGFSAGFGRVKFWRLCQQETCKIERRSQVFWPCIKARMEFLIDRGIIVRYRSSSKNRGKGRLWRRCHEPRF